MPLNIGKIRRQFPFLGGEKCIVYLDSAATAQKPRTVLRAMMEFLARSNANVHRGMYALSEQATDAYETARKTVQHFLHAKHTDEIIFTKNTTEALNLVARSWGRSNLRRGDTVVLSILEHHSNIVPWLQLKEEIGISIAWVDCDDAGELHMPQLSKALRKGTAKLVSITGQSNALGTRPPLKEIIRLAHHSGALVCVDAAQLIAHHAVDVIALDCDFLASSGHKLYGPTGIGVLYGKRKHLNSMPPFLGGGMMIGEVKKTSFTPADVPQRFEAGTPPIAEAIGLAAAIEWLQQFPWKRIEQHESRLMCAAFKALREIPGLRILGPQDPRSASGCVCFTVKGIHPHDLTDLLGREGFCLRAGHHCAEPLHERFGVPASARLSVGIYNTEEEIRSLGPALKRAIALLRK
jgi:cysteine desulfurase/selenocysteine lyase